MATTTDAPYLITLGLDPATFDRLDRLRSRYFPPDRNVVPAHISLFHHLPGDEGVEIDRVLAAEARSHAPVPLTFPSVRPMGRGVLATVEAPGLAAVRSAIARPFERHLTPQDRQPFRPHVTLMNKAGPAEVARAIAELRVTWAPWSGVGDRLLLWRYRGGPWEDVAAYPFTGAARPEDKES